MRPLRTLKPHQGLSLVELMVGIVIGLVITAGVLGVVVNSSRANSEQIRTIRLNQELRAIMDVMVRDIRRAGYRDVYSKAVSSVTTGTNSGRHVRICSGALRYRYNADNSCSGLNTATQECLHEFEFKLSSNAVLAASRKYTILTADIPNSQVDCAAALPPLSTISDASNTVITALTFCFEAEGDEATCHAEPPPEARTSQSGDYAQVQNVRITLTGRLKTDPDEPAYRRTLKETVRIRNDFYVNQ